MFSDQALKTFPEIKHCRKRNHAVGQMKGVQPQKSKAQRRDKHQPGWIIGEAVMYVCQTGDGAKTLNPMDGLCVVESGIVIGRPVCRVFQNGDGNDEK